jgi:hypothetical protein
VGDLHRFIGTTEYGLLKAGLRYDASIKDAVVWALIAGLPIYVKFDSASKDPTLLTKALFDAVRITALVEFFVNLYVLPLWVELPVQLLLLSVALAATAANMERSTPPAARRFLDRLWTFGGLMIVVVVVAHVVTHRSKIDWHETGLAFLQPVALTVAAVIATALVALIAAYEVTLGVNLRYPLSEREPRAIHRAALVLGLGFRLRMIAAFRGAASVQLRRTESLRAALAVVRKYRDGQIGPTDWPETDD